MSEQDQLIRIIKRYQAVIDRLWKVGIANLALDAKLIAELNTLPSDAAKAIVIKRRAK